MLHRGGELFRREAGRKTRLTDEEGVARQLHVAGRGGEDHAVGGDELDLAEDGLAIDAAHVGAGLDRGGELGFVAGRGLIDRGDDLRPRGADRRALFELTEGIGGEGHLLAFAEIDDDVRALCARDGAEFGALGIENLGADRKVDGRRGGVLRQRGGGHDGRHAERESCNKACEFPHRLGSPLRNDVWNG